jgi:hypothetical protein
MAILMLVVYCISKILVKSAPGAFVVTSALFIAFFFYETFLKYFTLVFNFLRFPDAAVSALNIVVRYSCYMIIALLISYSIVKIKRLKKLRSFVIGDTKHKSGVTIGKVNLPIKTKFTFAVVILAIFLLFAIRLLFQAFYEFFAINLQGQMVFSCAIIFALIVAYFCRKYMDKLKSKVIPVALIALLCITIIQNVIVIAIFASQQQSNDMFYKVTFNVDAAPEQQPNIYWFHTDGMLGFDAMSRFLGDDQEWFTNELESRGFWINREASFDTHLNTDGVIPALMSPYFYDRVMSWYHDPEYAESIPKNADLLNDTHLPNLRKEPSNISLRNARERNETVMAFNTAGFITSIISSINIIFYPTVNQFYNIEPHDATLMTATRSMEETLSFVNQVSNLQNLVDLLNIFTPIPNSLNHDGWIQMYHRFAKLLTSGFTTSSVEQRIDLVTDLGLSETTREHIQWFNMELNSLLDTLERSEPRFTLISFDMPHSGNWFFDERGNHTPEEVLDINRIDRYPIHHGFSTKVLLRYIDLIFEHDPDAVIILQADHGLHSLFSADGPSREEMMNRFSCTEDELLALWFSVMSAVRLPPEHMTPETEQVLSDPRNISRYLINNFVGQNYDYIPYQFRQVYKGPEFTPWSP